MFKTFATTLLCCATCTVAVAGPVKVIYVEPETATIYVDGNEVGTGSYTLKFDRNTDFFNLRFTAPGYREKKVKLFRNNPKKNISYKLSEDEAMRSSVGTGEGMDLANRWFDVNCRKGLSEETIWKRLMNIAVSNFEEVEVRDKAAGWIRTGWAVHKFMEVSVRTRMEIRLSFSGDDEVTYRVKIWSEIKENDCTGRDECYKKYDRVLRKYESAIQELKTSVGSDL